MSAEFEEHFLRARYTGGRVVLKSRPAGTGVVSHAGLVLLRELADRTGLTAGLSAALPSPAGGHDRGRVFADLACAIADGARVISDFRVMGDQRELFGPVASVPTAWRALKETPLAGTVPAGRVTAAVNTGAAARVGAGAREACRRSGSRTGSLEGVTCIRLDATVVPAHSHLGLPHVPDGDSCLFPRSEPCSRCVADVKERSLIVRWHLDHSGGSNVGGARGAAGRRGRGGRAGG